METLNKQILNNKIVEMRYTVRTARFRTINKLVKNIRKLKAKKGTDKQKELNKRKGNVYLEQIYFIKRIKDDEISKFALLNERSLVEVTNDVNEPLENKALVKLCTDKLMIDKVRQFREQFPDWKDRLPEMLESLGLKYKGKTNKSKSEKKIKPKKAKHLERVKPSGDSEDYDNINASQGINIDTDTTVDEIEKGGEIIDPAITVVIKNVNTNVNEKEIGQMSHTHHSDEQLPMKNTACISSEVTTEEQSIIVDPFFVTKDSRAYISVAKATTDAKETCVIQDKPPKLKRKEDVSSLWNITTKNDYKKSSSVIINNFKENKWKSAEESLHPSWEAKRRQQQPVRFKGKKITFDSN